MLSVETVEQIVRELTEAQKRKRVAQAEIDFLEKILATRRQQLGEPEPVKPNGQEPMTRREKVLFIMRADRNPRRQWARKQLQAAMVERDWLGRDQRAADNLGETLKEMGKRGEIVRPGIGFYQLPTLPPVQKQIADASPEAVAQRVKAAVDRR